tara:strand:- start:175 stop:1182 length:1008 start_codon:yes stop_codon:yes gene_type:complete
MKKICVTGGLGFIGGEFVKEVLNKDDGTIIFIIDDESNPTYEPHDFGVKVRCLLFGMVPHYDLAKDIKKNNVKIVSIQGDCSSDLALNFIANNNLSHVFHFAAKPKVEWTLEYPTESTVENFINVIDIAKVCADNNIRLVHSSTAAVYGKHFIPANGTPENWDKYPASPYAAAKLSAEMYLEMYSKLYNLNYIAFRYFNVYGENQNGDSPYATAVSAWKHRAENGMPLRSDGDGTQTRDMIHVNDVAMANLNLGFSNETGVFNVGTGKNYTNNFILSCFAEEGYTSVVNAPERHGDIKHSRADIKKILDTNLWSPKIKFQNGLKKIIRSIDVVEK